MLDPERAAALHLRPTDVAEQPARRDGAAGGRPARGARAAGHGHGVGASRARSPTCERIPVATAADGSPVPLSAIAERRRGRRGSPAARERARRRDRAAQRRAACPARARPTSSARSSDASRALAPGLPAGVRVEPVYDQAALVDESMRSVRDAILLGIAPVRAGHRAVPARPARRRGRRAGGAAHAGDDLRRRSRSLGQSLNLMSLGGLAVAIGLVIDDAIVVVEAIGRRCERGQTARAAAARRARARCSAGARRHDRHDRGRLPAARAASKAWSVSFFTALAVTLAAAVLFSLLVSLTLVPLARAALAARRAARRGASRLGAAYARPLRAAACAGPLARRSPCAARCCWRARSRRARADRLPARRWTKARSCSTTSCPPARR